MHVPAGLFAAVSVTDTLVVVTKALMSTGYCPVQLVNTLQCGVAG